MAGGAIVVALACIGALADVHHGAAPSRAALIGVWSGWWRVVSNPAYLACLFGLAVVERLHPARRDAHGRRAALAQDATWFAIKSLLAVTVVAAYLAALSSGVDLLAGWWRPDLVPLLGTGGAAFIAFVVGDLAGWWSHRLHHRVPLLWSFHAVHHSQTAMNVLSDNREHVVETVVNATLTFLPARLLGLDAATAGLLTFASLGISAFIHANIRTDLGWLRYVLISPQAHRVHHSTDPAHFDTNYGTVFAVWDYLFRTRHPDRHAYPDTGIEDTRFPMEHGGGLRALVTRWAAQTAYPFRALSERRTTRTWPSSPAEATSVTG